MILLLVAGRISVPAVARRADFGLAQTIPSVSGFEKFQQWALLVRKHVPGQWDEVARAVAAWPPDDLQLLGKDLKAVASLLAWQSTPSDPAMFGTLLPALTAPREGSYPRPTHGDLAGGKALLRVVKLRDVPALINVSAAEFRRDLERLAALPAGGPTRVYDVLSDPSTADGFSAAVRALEIEVIHFMEQAAMLHADIAALAPPRAARSAAAPGAGGSQSIVMRLLDGQAAGLDDEPVHWEIGRSALDAMRPEPSMSEAVRQFVRTWYRATSAHQLSRRSYGYARPHLESARAKLIDDARIQLYSGVVRESEAAPTVQAALLSIGATAVQLNVAPVRESLEHAERYFQRAIELDPTLTVALVHHARVIGLLGRHEAAVGELRRAMPSVSDPMLAYFVDLFLGAEEHALGHLVEAREAFEEAAARCPQAQSPYLALSQLAWQRGDRANALAAFDALAKLPAVESERVDPWWYYEVSTVLDHAALVTELIAVTNRERAR